jgi:uncharacterized membrane protein YphA (DoxX/SURF4 family)
MLGVWTRPLAVLLGLYTLATAFNGHPYWTLPEPADSDEVARAFRFDIARRSEMMSPGVRRLAG